MATTLALIAVTLAAALALLLPERPRGRWPTALAGPRARAVAMAVALVGAPAILATQVWDAGPVEHLRQRPGGGLILAALVVAALVAVVAGAALLRRRPLWTPLLVAAVLPFRVPIQIGDGQPVNLLVPLYLVTGAAALAWAWDRWREEDGVDPRGPAGAMTPGRTGPAGAVAEEGDGTWSSRVGPADVALLLFVVLYAVQSAWVGDRATAVEQVSFFYVPFSLLFVVLRTTPWTARLAARALAAAAAVAVALGAIGFYEYATKTVLLNPKVIASNQVQDAFRVNSLFFDPNIYGRFLALVMVGLVAWMLWSGRGRTVAICGLVLAFLWGAIVLTFSQTSFVALLAGLAVLGGLRFGARRAAAAVVAVALIGVVVVLAAPGLVHLDGVNAGAADKATSGRVALTSGGIRIFADHPIVGVGSGGFARAYRRADRADTQSAVDASHTIPITIAAEQGVIGLGAYLILLVLILRSLLRRAGESVARAGVAAMVVALIVHTLGYAAFLEDPVLWVLLAVGAALPPPGPRRRRRPDARGGGASAGGTGPAAETPVSSGGVRPARSVGGGGVVPHPPGPEDAPA